MGVVVAGAKANDENGFDFAADSTLDFTFGASEAENDKVDAALTGADTGVGAAAAVPKLNPWEALLEVPVLVAVFAEAAVPNPNNEGCAGAAEPARGAAGVLLPNEKPDEAGAPKLIAGAADPLGCPKLNADADGAAGVAACFTLDQYLVKKGILGLLTAPLRFGIPRILETWSDDSW